MKNRTEYKRYRQGKSLSAMMIAGMGLICMMLLSVMNAAAEGYLPYAGNNLKYGLIKNSSMAATDTGYVRIMNTADALYIEECDDDFQVITRKEIDKELQHISDSYPYE